MSTNRGSVKDSPPSRKASSTRNTPNFAFGMLIQVSRKLLFLDVRHKAIAHLIVVIFFSVLPLFLNFSIENSNFGSLAQKQSIFNQYGVKIGWFWTLFMVGPFLFYSSKLHHKNPQRVFVDVLRLLVATAMWYLTLHGFHWFREKTSKCDKSPSLDRETCSAQGGHWIPGMDISGHCFLMIYSILIISEEAKSFRNWNQVDTGANSKSPQFQLDSLVAQIFFVLMMVLHIFWDLQIVISCLYYHFFIDKLLGALFAVACWHLTYGILYRNGLLSSPINRRGKQTRSQ